MLKKLRDFVTGEPRKRQLIATLDDFLASAQDNSLTDEQAKKNLEEGVIELLEYGRHSSNGLLITDDGYFLTAKHCLEKPVPGAVRSYDGKIYKLERWSLSLPKYFGVFDVAIGKAVIPEKQNSKKYRICSLGKFISPFTTIPFKRDIVRLSRLNQELIFHHQKVLDVITLKGYNHLTVAIRYQGYGATDELQPGESGGILATTDARILGIHTSKQKKLDCNDYACNFGISIDVGLWLISHYKGMLESRL